MCLMLLALRAHPEMDLLLAGNRDEYYSRPSAPPAKIAANPPVFAGKDLEAGGTWMGRNEAGVVAALTNRRSPRVDFPPEVRSRGEIVMKLLGHRTPEAAAEWMAALSPKLYRPFSVLFGTADRFYYFSSEEEEPPRQLSPGFYALSNSYLDDRSWPKVDRSLEFFDRHQHLSGERLLEELQIFLGDKTRGDSTEDNAPSEEIHGALGAVFITTEIYGTVSSSIITAGGALGDRYYFAEGERLKNLGANEPPRQAFRLMEFAE